MKTKTLKSMVFLMLSFAMPYVSFSQDLPPDETVDTPIDSWLVVLLIVGAVYGMLKVWKAKKAEAKIQASKLVMEPIPSQYAN